MGVQEKLEMVSFFTYVKNPWSHARNIWPFPLKKYTLGQRKSSMTITQAAVARNRYFTNTANSAYVQLKVQRGIWALIRFWQKKYNQDKAFHLLHMKKKKRINIKGFTSIWTLWKASPPLIGYFSLPLECLRQYLVSPAEWSLIQMWCFFFFFSS